MTYGLTGWILIQVATNVFPVLEMPKWTTKFIILLVLIGFPIALVFAWAFEITPEGVRRTPPEEPAESETGKKPKETYFWVSIFIFTLFLMTGWWFMEQDMGGEMPVSSAQKITEKSIAVLPFEVSGSGAETWRDGMVTMLSTGLDGAAGFRAIAEQTVFSAWSRIDTMQRVTGKNPALETARLVGAGYAIMGSAVAMGEELRLVAKVYETKTGQRLGQTRVEGSPDQVVTMTDELTREVLKILLEEGESVETPINLERITTKSLPALKSYLTGNRLHRAGDLTAAIDHYEHAVEQDSGFAMAYYKLALARWFLWAGTEKGMIRALNQAYKYSNSLPKRERSTVRAFHLYRVQKRIKAAEDTLRRLTRNYPDDSMVWHHLGELLMHYAVPRGWTEAEQAFQRAVKLQPESASNKFHLLHLAFSLHRDSSLVASRFESLPDFEEPTIGKHVSIAKRLVFGNQKQRSQAYNYLDTVAVATPWTLIFNLYHPMDTDLRGKVLRKLYARPDVRLKGPLLVSLQRNNFDQGRIAKALTDLQKLQVTDTRSACLIAEASSLGLPIPQKVLHRYLEPSNIKESDPINRFFCAGMYLINNRKDELSSILKKFRELQDENKINAYKARAMVNELKGYRAWNKGNMEAADKFWSRVNPSEILGSDYSGNRGAIWRGDLYRKIGQLQKAEGWYLAAWIHPVAQERLGQLYEEMNQPEKAAAAYRRFIEAWKNADESLQDRVDKARERLQQLTNRITTAER